ncbi:MAG: adenylate/guanylate cyclase domain-containing protein [Burkholderiales bacterium]
MIPQTKYAKSGSVSIAYQVFGSGAIDLVMVPGWMSNIDIYWEEPGFVRFFERLARFSRVMLFDKRGTGLSDRVTDTPTLEERMDDVRAVMDAVGSKRAALVGYSEGGPMCALFSVTYPERTEALIMIGAYPRIVQAPDYSWGRTPEQQEGFLNDIRDGWGGPVGIEARIPSKASEPRFRDWWIKFLRNSASPATALALTKANAQIDVRYFLASIRVPTLLIHATGDRTVAVEHSRYMAQQIAGAKLIEMESDDHLLFLTEKGAEIDDVIEDFLTGKREPMDIDRVVCTIMFVDIADSTALLARLGDREWRDVLDGYYGTIRRELAVYRGKEIDTAGDGFFAAFDGPARAIRCGRAVVAAVRNFGISVRVGIHTGECETRDDKITGLAVHVGARVAALAPPDEVLVSQTVRDLVAGSGLEFESFGVHALKGVPEPRQLYTVM